MTSDQPDQDANAIAERRWTALRIDDLLDALDAELTGHDVDDARVARLWNLAERAAERTRSR